MHCGNCHRDNALVHALRSMGHDAITVPLYLPIKLDEPAATPGTPIFFSGINVYLAQKSRLFRVFPEWLRRPLAHPALLKWAGSYAGRTRPEEVGDLTYSMLRGEAGNQAAELEALVQWLGDREKPDVICLSNALLSGMIHRLRQALGLPVVCMLQGEDAFVEALPRESREAVWAVLRERVREADALVAPSRYFADKMSRHLRLSEGRVRVVPNGISLEGYPAPGEGSLREERGGQTVGYFARMCRDKGLDLLVDAFIRRCQSGKGGKVCLKIGGSCGPSDEPFVQQLKDKLGQSGLSDRVSFHPNLTRDEKIAFLRSLDVFSVPASYGEAFGLYLIEAWAAGVPAVQPACASFPELLQATGGGLLFEPGNAQALCEAWEQLLASPGEARRKGLAGQQAVRAEYSTEAMAKRMLAVFEDVAHAAGNRSAAATTA
jgi:glycosyltransferase involved in cell wall biosynthesis